MKVEIEDDWTNEEGDEVGDQSASEVVRGAAGAGAASNIVGHLVDHCLVGFVPERICRIHKGGHVVRRKLEHEQCPKKDLVDQDETPVLVEGVNPVHEPGKFLVGPHSSDHPFFVF